MRCSALREMQRIALRARLPPGWRGENGRRTGRDGTGRDGTGRDGRERRNRAAARAMYSSAAQCNALAVHARGERQGVRVRACHVKGKTTRVTSYASGSTAHFLSARSAPAPASQSLCRSPCALPLLKLNYDFYVGAGVSFCLLISLVLDMRARAKYEPGFNKAWKQGFFCFSPMSDVNIPLKTKKPHGLGKFTINANLVFLELEKQNSPSWKWLQGKRLKTSFSCSHMFI